MRILAIHCRKTVLRIIFSVLLVCPHVVLAQSLNDIIDVFTKMSLITKSYGEYSDSVFNCFDLMEYNSFIDKKDLEIKINSLYESVYKFCKLISDFKSLLEVNKELLSKNNVINLIEMIKLILTEKVVFNTLLKKDIYLNHDKSLEVLDKGIALNNLKKKLTNTFKDSILSINSSIYEFNYNNANFISKLFVLNKIKKELKMHLTDMTVKLDKHYMLSVLRDVSLYKKYVDEIKSSNDYLLKLFNDKYSKFEDNFELMKEYYLNTISFKQYFDKLIFDNNDYDVKAEVLSGFVSLYNKLNESDIISFKLNNIIDSYNKYLLCEEDLKTSYKINIDKFNFKCSFDYYNEYSVLLDKMNSGASNIEGIVLYNKAFVDLYDKKVLNKIIEFYKSGKCNVFELPKYFYSYYYFNILKEYFYDKYYQEFNGVVFDDAIRKYNELLDSYTELIILETASKVTKNYPVNDFEYAKSSKIYGLQRCIKNNGYKTTIRNILKEYGELIRNICPVFLMSPISAAQYLSLDSERFDIVIFDEASQILTAEAIGAISRGESLVVAGDPEQMPPTTFFKTFIESSEDDVLMNVDDLESLLDDALALNMKRNRLLWHYRSTHESLIAFSNNTFYDHSLFTFPSPDNTLCKVSYNYVNNAIYDHGVNVLEADEIVKEVVRRFDDPVLCKDSIGIVTFNIKQKELILDKITEVFDKNPKYYEINESNADKLFVKNLENVQGDERDCIIFSIGFGYDKNHKFNHFFGPLSLEKGERRLNVAVTRSKKEMIVYSSIHSGDIKSERAKNRGAEVLKQFLMYAEVGPSCLIIENKNQYIAQGGIEYDIKEELAKLGYDCDILVGDSKFKINVCVKNDSGEYILGILIDGGVSSLDSTCRDRNTVQIKTLQRLDWNVINIYSIDYIKDREKVLDRIIESTKKHCKEFNLKEPLLIIEPGRSLICSAGFSLYTIGSEKNIEGIRKYIAIDGGMADNPRPSMYQAKYSAEVCNHKNEVTEKVTIAEAIQIASSAKNGVTTSEYIIRNHDKNLFEKQINDFINIEEQLNKKYNKKVCSVTIKRSYKNMKEKIDEKTEVLEYPINALKAFGYNPTFVPIRGGTDGASLSYNGIPCPNLGTGTFNMHGPYEFSSITDMNTMVNVLIKMLEYIK